MCTTTRHLKLRPRLAGRAQVFLLASASQAFLLNLCIFWCTTLNSPLATTVTGAPATSCKIAVTFPSSSAHFWSPDRLAPAQPCRALSVSFLYCAHHVCRQQASDVCSC